MNSIMKLLEQINSPEDLKKLSPEQLPALCAQIRQYLIEVCSQQGGHLGSNLGVVELTTALHYVFNSPDDKILFDISHQGYVHKILTGRREYLKTLREHKACSGFLQREESAHDCFGAGHAGTSISAGLGFAAARDALKQKHHVISIVGDAALGNGISLEALNHAEDVTKKFIVILNDNKMSISPNVGALSKYLNRLLTDSRYKHLRGNINDIIARLPKIGGTLNKALSRVEEGAKGLITPGIIFEELGFRYIGPIEGHDISELCKVLSSLKEDNQPILLHVLTKKGKGFAGADDCPEKCHGFKKVSSTPAKKEVSFSEAFGKSLLKIAEKDKRVVGITAGMLSGTGMNYLQEKYPEKVYDTGIAEEHAATFAAGLSAGGLRPFVAIYATFMQRAMDSVYHDICIQDLPVTFCLDRAGLVEDGPTHHGIYDLGFWLSMPRLTVMQARDQEELSQMMELSMIFDYASLLRYPKASAENLDVPRAELKIGKSEVIREGTDVAIWCIGRECLTGLEIADKLAAKGINAKVVNARFLQPFDRESLIADALKMPILNLEDHVSSTGMGSIITNNISAIKHQGFIDCGLPANKTITWGKPQLLRKDLKLDPESIIAKVEAFLNKK